MTIYKEYWQNSEPKAVTFLDSLPDEVFDTFLQQGYTIDQIVDLIERQFDDKFKEITDSNSCLFNDLTKFELMEYLEVRFKAKFKEVLQYVLVK